MPLFSERERGPQPRTSEKIGMEAWQGIASIIQTRIDDGSFGLAFPMTWVEGNDTVGTNSGLFVSAVIGNALPWPPQGNDPLPNTLAILDLVEFCYEKTARATRGAYHDYYRHYHLQLDEVAGKALFSEEVNRVFTRNGIAFELEDTGQIQRLAPIILGDALAAAVFKTGDHPLDELLETARHKFLQPKPVLRREALEKLWDAWERLKTLEDTDKKKSIGLTLDKASTEPKFRALLEGEAKSLTEIGNSFMIRHTEVGKTEIDYNEHVDYLFHRMFAIIRLLLRATGRGG